MLRVIGVVMFPSLVLAAVVAITCWWFAHTGRGADLIETYATGLRGSLFAGFLTMGSFLLSLKTGLVIKVKEQVYDDIDYQKDVKKDEDPASPVSIYGPLRRLSAALSASVLAALVAAVAQITLGLIESTFAVSVCLALAAMAVSMLVTSFLLIQGTLHAWFARLEPKALKKLAEEAAKADQESSDQLPGK